MHREVMYTKFPVWLASDVYSLGDKLRILGLPLGPPGRLVMSGKVKVQVHDCEINLDVQ